MKSPKGIGVSKHTKTIRQNGIKYRYVYILKKVVSSDEITKDEIKSYPVVKQGSMGLYLYEFDHKEVSIDDQKVYDERIHTCGRPVGSKDSYKRIRRWHSKKAGK